MDLLCVPNGQGVLKRSQFVPKRSKAGPYHGLRRVLATAEQPFP